MKKTTGGLFCMKGFSDMAKDKKTVYFCQNCGYESGKWMGQCPACRQWNTFVEEVVSTKQSPAKGPARSVSRAPVKLSEMLFRLRMAGYSLVILLDFSVRIIIKRKSGGFLYDRERKLLADNGRKTAGVGSEF